LTRNDTVVVDPRNTGGVGKDNEDVGPRVHLEDVRGTVIVVAYETNEDCDPFTDVSSPSIADDTIVGAFTLADIDVGYSFGNDAFGLGEADNVPNKIIVPTPDDEDLHYEFAIQTFRPESVEASQVILTHLQETNPTGPVVPVSSVLRFATSFVDTTEIPVSLPDTTVSCTEFFSISGDLIPDSTTVSSSGIIRLQPTSGFVDGRDYLYGIVGQAVDEYGASSSLKVEQVSSASPAFLEANGLF
jgi:hypothetical protein